MFNLSLTLLIPIIGAFLARFGLIYTYSGALIAYAFTHSILCTVATSLAILFGNAIGELHNITGDPNLYASQGDGIYEYESIRKRDYALIIFKRFLAFMFTFCFIATAFEKIPLPALNWIIYVPFFGFFVISNERRQFGTNGDDPGLYVVIGVLCGGLTWILGHLNIPISTALIGVAAISKLLAKVIHGDVYEDPNYGNDAVVLNWFEILIATAFVWVTPGLTSGAASRATFANPNWLLGVGTIDVLLEGWVLGTWLWNGHLSGKTMLGSSLQIWTSRAVEANPYAFSTGTVVLILLGAIPLALLANLLIVWLLDPVVLEKQVLAFLPYIIIIPIVIQTIIIIRNPIALSCVGIMSILVALIGKRPGVRSLVLLFVTAG